MSDVPDNEDAKNELLETMLGIIERKHWKVIRRDAVLWKQVVEGNGEKPGLLAPDIKALKEQSDVAGGWWTDLHENEKPRFVTWEQWKLIYPK